MTKYETILNFAGLYAVERIKEQEMLIERAQSLDDESILSMLQSELMSRKSILSDIETLYEIQTGNELPYKDYADKETSS